MKQKNGFHRNQFQTEKKSEIQENNLKTTKIFLNNFIWLFEFFYQPLTNQMRKQIINIVSIIVVVIISQR